MIPIYTRILSPKEFGIIELITLFGTVVSIFLNLEIHQAVARFYPDGKSAEEKKKIVSTAFWFIFCSYLLFNMVALFFYPEISKAILNESGHARLFSLAIWTLTLNFIFYFLQSQLTWQLRSRQNAISAITYTILTAGCTLLLMIVCKLGVAAVFWGQLIAASVGIVLSFRFARESYGLVFDFTMLKRMASFSLPLVPSSLAVYGMLYVDRYIISHYLSLNEVGLYSVAFKLASTIGLMTIGVQTALTPLIYTHYQEPETPGNIAILFRYFFLAGMAAITVISVFARDIMVLFTQPAYYDAAQLVPFLLMSVFFSGILNFSPGIFIKNRTILIVYINIAMFVTNVVLNITFVQHYGVMGAAVATMLSSMAYFGLYQILGNRLYPVPYPWIVLLAAFICSWCGVALVLTGLVGGLLLKAVLTIVTVLLMTLLISRSRDWKRSLQFFGADIACK